MRPAQKARDNRVIKGIDKFYNGASMRPAQKARDNFDNLGLERIDLPASMRPAQKARDNPSRDPFPWRISRGFNEARAKSTG